MMVGNGRIDSDVRHFGTPSKILRFRGSGGDFEIVTFRQGRLGQGAQQQISPISLILEQPVAPFSRTCCCLHQLSMVDLAALRTTSLPTKLRK